MIIPTVSVKFGNPSLVDIYSRLLEDRIVFVDGVINSDVSSLICAKLLHLDAENHKPINIYINSPGGCLYSGLAIYDVIKLMKSEVHTTVVGLAASAGSIILVAGKKGCRSALKHSRIMLHQPLGSTEGQAADIEIYAKEITEQKQLLEVLYLNETNIHKSKIKMILDRNSYLGPVKAKEFGVIDKIIENKINE